MKKLLLVLSLNLGLTTVASSSEIIMKCCPYIPEGTKPSECNKASTWYKFKDGFFSDKVFVRREGGWEEWCKSTYGYKPELILKDKGAICYGSRYETTVDFVKLSWLIFDKKEKDPSTGLNKSSNIRCFKQ